MADASREISIQITDGVASTIAPKIRDIGQSARDTDASVKALKTSLDALGVNAATALKTQLDNTAGSAEKLAKARTSLESTTAKLNEVTQANGVAEASASAATLKSAQYSLQLAEARTTLRTATRNLAQAQADVGQSAAAGNVQAQQIIATYKEEQLAAAQYIIQLRALRAAQTQVAETTKVATTAHQGSITPVMAASAAIRGLEGNFGTSVRAGERFLVTTLKLGPILQAAFPIFGALALAGILDILVEHVGKLIDAFKRLKGAETDAEIQAIETGEKILKIKPEGFFTASNFSRLLAGDFDKQQPIEVANAQAKLKEIQYAKELANAQAELNEKGLTGVALQKAKVAAVEQEIEFAKNAKTQADALAAAYKEQLKATKEVATVTPSGGMAGTFSLQTNTIRKVSDETQIKGLEEQLRTAAGASAELNHQTDLLKIKLEAVKRGEPLAELHDNTKAARLQLAAFKDELAQLKINKGGVVTPQDELKLFEDQRKRALAPNIPEVDTHIGTATQAIERQNSVMAQLTEKYVDQSESIGLYSDKLREQNALNKLDLQLKKDNITGHETEIAQIKDAISYTATHSRYQRELRAQYEQIKSPQLDYTASLEAINKLEKDGAITHNQALIAQNEATLNYQKAINPLNEYAHSLENEVALLSKYGTELSIATQLQRVQDELRVKGRALTDTELQQLGTYLTKLNQQKQIQQEINRLYEQNIGVTEKLTVATAALMEAHNKGFISEEKYRLETAKLKVEAADLAITLGKATSKDLIASTVGSYIKDFQGFTRTATTLYQNMFAQIADGAANSLGRALVYGEDLGEALKNVAREALSELIGGFIKLGIQMLIQHILGQTLAKITMAATIAQAAAAAVAWAPAAALASLATLGANAAPAAAGMAAVTGLAEGIAALSAAGAGAGASSGFMKDGGPVIGPGTGTSDSVMRFLSNGEYVVNADAAARNRDLLDAINYGGASVQKSKSVGTSGGSRPLVVNVEHDGSTAIQVQRITEDEVRVIAKQESVDAVRKHAPKAIAGDLENPNSITSKAVRRNTTAGPRR